MFDVGKLKVLPNAQLVGALIDEAHLAVADMPPGDRANLESRLLDVYWLPTETEQAMLEARSDEVDLTLGKLASAIMEENTGEKLDPEEAKDQLKQIRIVHAFDRIASLKFEIAIGISDANVGESDWNEGITRFNLLQICEKQREAGIESELDYVRETALAHLSSSNSRSIVLISNALSGDSKSFALGLGYLKESLVSEGLGWDDASDGLRLISEFINGSLPDEITDLKDLALDLLARLRQWKGALPSYSSAYALAAAELAVTLRDHELNE